MVLWSSLKKKQSMSVKRHSLFTKLEVLTDDEHCNLLLKMIKKKSLPAPKNDLNKKLRSTATPKEKPRTNRARMKFIIVY